jgi:hypothetical protein
MQQMHTRHQTGFVHKWPSSSYRLRICTVTGNHSSARRTRLRTWLRRYATSQRVAGSNSDEVIGAFQFTQSFKPHHGPGIDLASKRWVLRIFLGVKRGRHVWLTTLLSSMRRLSRQCGIPDVSQPVRPQWPVSGIAFRLLRILLYLNVGNSACKCLHAVSTSNNKSRQVHLAQATFCYGAFRQTCSEKRLNPGRIEPVSSTAN